MKRINNKYKMPIKLWKSFSTPVGKNVFNLIYYNCIGNQKNLIHPKQKALPAEQWKTIVWNMTCEGAWATDGAIQNKKGDKV